MSESPAIQSSVDVLMATTSYPRDEADWKGRFIYDLARSLDQTGRARVRLWGPPGDLPGGVISANSAGDSVWLQQMAERGGIAHLLRRSPLSGLLSARGVLRRLRAACVQARADIYHVNWLQLVLGLPNDGRPVYVGVLGSDFGLLRLPGMSGLLRRAFSRRRTLLAPNAGWMTQRLNELFGDLAEIRPNPFGVSSGWFDVDRDTTSTGNWLVVSRITRNKLGDLVAWGEGLFNGERHLQLLGPMQEDVALPKWVEHGGPTNPDRLRRHWFPMAAGLLTLSRHDEGRPQVLIEAMAAGLPVIASRIPAHADLIRHGETGWLVGSRDELTTALQQAETPSIAADVGGRARAWIRDRVGTWDDHANRCLAAYDDLLRRESRDVG